MYNYMCAIDLDLVTLTSGTVYYSLFNAHTHDVYINKFLLQTMSATGSGNTKCMFSIARANGATPTGGTIVTYTKTNTQFKTINMDIRKSTTGLVTTGTNIDAYFIELAVKTGSDGHMFPFDFGDSLVISPTQGIIIQADGDMVSGASLHGTIQFSTDTFY